jgi:hypothetical protein
MADGQLQNQLQRFLKRGQNRRRKDLAETDFKPTKQAKVPQFRPVKRSRKY